MTTQAIHQRALGIFIDRLQQQGLTAEATDGLDALHGVVHDEINQHFRGNAPFYFHLRCRRLPSTTGISPEVIEEIRTAARAHMIREPSLYYVIGFFERDDVRDIVYFAIPFGSLSLFLSKNNRTYRFSVKQCRRAASRTDNGVFEL